MKKILSAFLILAWAAGSLRAAPVASRIAAVTVYPDRAVVSRTAALDLPAGTQEIGFERLPATLLDASLQVAGNGTASATILDVQTRQTYVDFTPNERVKGLEDQLRALQKQFRSLDDRAATLNEERNFLKRMLTASTGVIVAPAGAPRTVGAPAHPALDEWQKLYAYSDETFGRIAEELQGIDTRREELTAAKSALEKELNALHGAGSQAYKTVTVRVSAANAGNLQLTLAYTVPNASWTPTYDARLRSAARAVDLTYFGVVRQNTGEDWTDVALTLSTARPSLGGAAPVLPRWWLDIPAPVRPVQAAQLSPFEVDAQKDKGYYAENTVAGSRLRGNVADSASSITVVTRQQLDDVGGLNLNDAFMHETGSATALVDRGVTSATFHVATPTSLPSNNSTQKVAIATATLATKLDYEASPKLLEAAFLHAAAVNTTDYPLLAGTMNTFLDDVFVAAGSLKTVMPGEKLALALGADEGIAIKRRVVQRFAEDTGLTNSGRRVTYEFAITVTNNKKTAETLTFREPLPVSRNEKIMVKLLAPQERDLGTAEKPREITREADGHLAWRLELKPGETREIPLKFSVDYPNEVAIAGLE